MKNIFQFSFWLFISLVFIISVVIILDPIERIEGTYLESNTRPFLLRKLQFQHSISYTNQFSKKEQLIYIMGGSEESLRERIKKASQLYHKNSADKILIFIKPGKTSFDKSINRNLTNKEWALKLLSHLKVQKNDVEFVQYKEGFWGTLSESRNLLKLAAENNYRHIHIVTSLYHTRRTWITFSKFSHTHDISFSIYGADDVSYLRYLLKEYGKLLLYQYVLLPLYAFSSTS